eukprot:TRINITY_DN32539_c0_g1_i1.p1 TRINITY_DN32539_c0_g1~~TRINITY_DN32539_c0_g1_i1.p1  ORF type:complete len:485 (+),score=264.10 TRINITY_DN32539_c0_g1_i1:67-1455(+)
MSAEEVDQAMLDKTKKELGAIIKAPRLSDKLLKKPPFRFLHDIVTNIIKTTGFATKLYTDEEMDSAKMLDKDSKVLFLQKVISSVNYTLKLQPPLSSKPIKIVSGLEPQHTNEFLQKLAAATKIPVEKSDRAIGKVLSKFADKEGGKDRRASAASAGGGEAKEAAPAPAKEEAKKPAAEEPAKPLERTESAREEKKVHEKRPHSSSPKKAEEAPAPAAEAPPAPAAEAEKKPEIRKEVRKEKEVKQEAVKGPQGVIIEGDKGKKGGLEKGTLDTDSEEEQDPADAMGMFQHNEGVSGGEGDGHLAKLVAEKKEKEEAKQRALKESTEKVVEEGAESGIRLQTTRRAGGRERDVYTTEISKLKDSLQTLVKITNPLGKTFDYVQEDLDSMSREKVMWQRQAQDTKVQAQQAEHATEESLQPLYSQIQDLEDAISDQLVKIHTTRSNILKNDGIIETLLGMISQ